ncbi:hypothetical protein PG985_010326 [Apiospora marii]|uniref:REJ domain-containing protein n=1 Tax=Apiospora marii TaxID=335849 RepID=A0ABR1RLK7_9PEZI
MDASTNQQQPEQRAGGMAPTRGFQSSRPFQFQPLSINTSGEAKSTSMHSASSSISSCASSAADSTFSSLPTSPTSPTTAQLSPPASSLGSSTTHPSTSTTHIHKAPDGSLLMNRDYQSPSSPPGEGFLDPRATTTTTRGSSSSGLVRGSRASTTGSVQVARLHMNMQVSGGAELNMHVRGNVDMIVIQPPARQHRGTRR